MSKDVLETTEIFEQAKNYWITKLSCETPQTFYLDDTNSTYVNHYFEKDIRLEESLAQKVIYLSKSNDLSIYVILLAVFKLTLSRYLNHEDICVASPTLRASDQTYNNCVVFRDQIEEGSTFKEFLIQVRETVLEGYKNQFYPIRKIMEHLDQDVVHSLFHIMFYYENIHEEATLASVLSEQSNEMVLSLHQIDGQIKGGFRYRPHLFTEEKAERFVAAFQSILTQVMDKPEVRIADLNVLSADEMNTILYKFNDARRCNWEHQTIIDLFEEQVIRHPEQVCISLLKQQGDRFAYDNITYDEINQKANQLARYLRQCGVVNNDIIALVMTPSLEMYTSILGVMKAGAAYLPVDPSYPDERIQYTIQDSRTTLVLSDVDNFAHRLAMKDVQLIDFHQLPLHLCHDGNLEERAKWENLAYVIYTSGTTGKPKGVLIEHRNVINTLQFRRMEHGLNETDVILQLNPYGFDGFVATFFTPLIAGATIITLEDNRANDMEMLSEAIRTNGVTHFASVPVLYEEMLEHLSGDDFKSVRTVVLAGDRIRPDIILKSKEKFKSTELVIEYGVSECSVLSTFCKDIPLNGKALIGKPIMNTKLYVLNKYNALQPLETVGELCISGDGVSSRGYLRNDGLSAEKFIDNPFENEGKLYKTGDLVRWLPDGNLEFLGRSDHQIKIRGYRIELGEIENALIKFPNIHTAVVIAKEREGNESRNQEKMLWAYYVRKSQAQAIESVELKKFLSSALPEYMIPSSFVEIDEIPLTIHGKLDMHRLPKPSITPVSQYTAPTDEVESRLVEIWSEVLSTEKEIIGIDASFFEYGGHSLNVTKVVAKINKLMNVKISIVDVFERLSIRKIADLIRSTKQEQQGTLTIPKATPMELYPVSSAQQRIYYLQQLDTASTAYNLVSAMELQGTIHLEQIQATLSKLIQRHDSLRTVFPCVDGVIYQKIHGEQPFNIDLLNSQEISEEGIGRIIDNYNSSFDLSSGPLIKAGCIQMAADRLILLVIIHHIIADGISVQILIDEFMQLYGDAVLPKPEIQYKDYAVWQNNRMNELDAQRSYWLQRLAGNIPVIDLPYDFKRPNKKAFYGDSYRFALDAKELHHLKNIANEQSASTFMVMLSVFYLFLYKMTNQSQLIVGVPVSGRRNAEFDSIIGMFVNTLGLKLEMDSEMTFMELLQLVRDHSVNDFDNQEYPYENLVNDLVIGRVLNRNPLFDVMFNYQNIDIPEFNIPGLSINEYEFNRKISKFDLTLHCLEETAGFSLEFEFDTELFRSSTIRYFAACFKNLLLEIGQGQGGKKLHQYNVIPVEESHVFNDFNATITEYPAKATVVSLFEQQAHRRPDKLAVLGGDQERTFNEINHRSNVVANRLANKGIGSGSVVALLMDNSVELVIAILAILKTGAAYLPISMEYPQERKEYILSDSQAQAILTTEVIAQSNLWMQQKLSAVNILAIDSCLKDEPAEALYSFTSRCIPDDTAYVIYTSGSTGMPKGVVVKHSSLMNYVWWAANNYVRNEEINFPLFTSVAFDLTVTSIFTPLITGNSIIVFGEADHTLNLARVLQDERIGAVKLTPSHLSLVKHMKLSGQGIKRFIVGGESLSVKLANEIHDLFEGHVEIINEYGPTEATVGCMIHIFDKQSDTGLSVPIGRPADNCMIYLLDQFLHPVPTGVTGEIYIAGACLSKGYLGNRKLTEERFVSHPYIEGLLMYRTGDLAKMNHDGNIEYINRIDSQVKHRGYRLELTEIEHELLQIPGIERAIAAISQRENLEDREKELIAYIVADPQTTDQEIKIFLRNRLPQFMVPDRFIFVESIPTTPHGKVDYEGLSRMPAIARAQEDYFSPVPQNNLENRILMIWKEVLFLEHMRITDNFFDIGGKSIDILRLAARLEEEFQQEVPITVIFDNPTVAYLAEYFMSEGSLIEQVDLEIEESMQLLDENLLKFIGDDDE
ncbi:amino acid adenylation domain-containing protein [Paenibacillus sp. HN-1]|uniref:non-ribosomal peptide synthetase n=1 Tax=Paenibacillus TaxID=44249 RepID=UPI001CA8B9CD|nr:MULTISPECIES: non-ribosomal peptide synthetase [Paenibacillus]MBY9077396.1 amino acid adenylation domain-containing protein [Paenibacillus sp. CGMCC 1.18879]MBY9087495.1 amino acid adenylation domain-containing protein [Paenibacillus sinensis]